MEGFSLNSFNIDMTNILEMNDAIPFFDKHGNEYSSRDIERDEQIIANKYIDQNDIILEIGCRYGTVSCVLARKCKKLVSVDADKEAIETCKKNMKRHGVNFECIWCTVSKNGQNIKKVSDDGYGDFTEEDSNSEIPHYSISELEEMFSIKFNTIVADCEGCLEKIFKENDLSNINKIIYETDRQEYCDYEYISKELKTYGLTQLESVDRGDGIKNICWKKIN